MFSNDAQLFSQPQVLDVGVSLTQAFVKEGERRGLGTVDLSEFSFVEATDASAHNLLATVPAHASISVHVGTPGYVSALPSVAPDPQLLEVGVLAALQRAGRDALDIVQLPGYSANSLISRAQVEVLRDLKDEGLVRNWGVRVRTVKQAMRAMSLLGISYVSFNASDLGANALQGILAAAQRARTTVIVSVGASTPLDVIATLRQHPCVLGVLVEVNSREQLIDARTSLKELQNSAPIVQIA